MFLLDRYIFCVCTTRLRLYLVIHLLFFSSVLFLLFLACIPPNLEKHWPLLNQITEATYFLFSESAITPEEDREPHRGLHVVPDMYSGVSLRRFFLPCVPNLLSPRRHPLSETPGGLKALWIHVSPPTPPPAYCDCPVTFLHKGTVSTRRTDERTRGWAGAQIPLWFRSSTGRYSALPWHAKISH